MSSKLPNGYRYAPGWNESYVSNKLGKENFEKILAGAKSTALAKPIESEAFEDSVVTKTLEAIKSEGVEYGDFRFGRDHNRQIYLSNENISEDVKSESSGIGVRVLFNGFWGFSATSDLTDYGLKGCVKKASDMAKAVAKVTPKSEAIGVDKWTHEPVHTKEVHTPVAICPFDIPTAKLAEPLVKSAIKGLEREEITRVQALFNIWGYRRIFASTTGTRILNTHVVSNIEQRFFAVTNGTSAYRTIVSPGYAGGAEHFFSEDFLSQVDSTCDDAIKKCFAKKPEAGEYDLILDGHHLALTMHESVGHPTELDRILGYELSMAGGSFASIDKIDNFQYGSKIVNFTGDNTILFGGASQGFDDEGVECSHFPIIRDGILKSFGTNRETARELGLERSQGTARAQGWKDVPIVRIPNLYLEPGKEKLSLDDLIKDTKHGILMLGRDSFSIDQMRYNFQFGGDMCYLIEDGKITEPLRDAIYQSITPEFWNSCDAICDESEWQFHGVFNCGKGHPMQGAKMMHGASPARFRNVKVGF
jgi:TldD protein